LDALQIRSQKTIAELQYEDLFSLGKLVLSLACQSLDAIQHIGKSVELIASQYSSDLKSLVTYLLTKPKGGKLPTISTVSHMISHRLINEIHHTFGHIDYQEAELAKEIQNGRLFRLLVKMGFINERPEFDHDPRWAETGDRYLVKLFRDFVFHQQHHDGSANVDFGHVVDCLNKLDAGSSEKTMLVSRNEESILVVSYDDLKRGIQEAFDDLQKNKTRHHHNNNITQNITQTAHKSV